MNKNRKIDSSAVGNEVDNQANWFRCFWLFWTVITVWRLSYLVISPLELAMDEAYYWDWGRLPDWGYYSKPPLIAWINTFSSAFFGATEFGVRLPAVLLGAAGLIVIFFLARRLFDNRTAFWTVLLTTLSPGACLLNFVMTIDAPFMFFWLSALFFFWQALESRGSSSGGWWWVLLSVSIGMGVLSKEMMLIFPLLMLLFLAFSREDRFWLRTLRLWGTSLVGLLFLFPTLLWNARHNWITIHHSASHFGGNSSIWRFLQTVPDFIVGQIFIISPLTVLPFLFIAFRLTRRRIFLQDRRIMLLLLFSFLPLAVFFAESFRQRINGNWPAVFYPAAIILTAAWLTGTISVGVKNTSEDLWRSRIRLWAPITGVVLIAMVYTLSFILPRTGSLAGKRNPLSLLTGWQQLAAKVDAIRCKLPQSDRVILVTDHRETAAELAFYLPDKPHIYIWNESKVITSQYDLWPGPADLKGWDAIAVFRNPHPPSNALVSSFKKLTATGPLTISLGGNSTRSFTVFLGEKLQSWP